MIKVSGLDPAVVARRMRHHAEEYRPMVTELVYGILLESDIARDNKIHRLVQSRTGPGSFGLYLSDGREFHFRPGGAAPHITVYDAYRKGRVVAALTNPAMARMFARKLKV